MKKYGKKVLLGLLGVLIIMQFIQPDRNVSGAAPGDITGKYAVSENVMAVLKPACYDCHSNQTRYPWYAGIQPVAWWLAEHVNDGKRHLNFDEFTTRKIAVQNHKLEEIIEMVKE
ncbi:MAG: heme-binding domain-containing protein, partial [Bacteroidota bacterium]